MFVEVREDAAVGVAPGVGEDGAGFRPAGAGHFAEDVAIAIHGLAGGFRGEVGDEALGEIAAAVEADVHDDGLLAGAAAIQVMDEALVVLRVHEAEVDVAEAALGKLLGELHALRDPAVVRFEEAVDERLGRDDLIHRCAAFRRLNGKPHGLAGGFVEQRVNVRVLANRLAIHGEDDRAGAQQAVGPAGGAGLEVIGDLRAGAGVGVIVVKAERSRRIAAGRLSVIRRTHVRGVQLARHFAEQLGEVFAVAQVRQVLRVFLLVEFPIHAGHVLAVELLLGHAPDVLEEPAHLALQVVGDFGGEGKGGGGSGEQVHPLDAARAEEKDVLAFAIGDDASRGGQRLREQRREARFPQRQLVTDEAGGGSHIGKDERFAVRREREELHDRGERREPHGAGGEIVQLGFPGRFRFLLLGFGVGLLRLW